MHAQPSPPAPAASAQLRSVHGASAQAVECGMCDYEDQLIEARRISWQACAAIFAGMLGILAIILEPVGFSQASGDRLIGPGVCGGAWCIAQAVWAGFLLFNARKVMTLHAYYRRIRSGARSPMSTSLQCNASALTTFTAFTFLGLVVCGWMSISTPPINLNEGYDKAVGAILFSMAVVTVTASILGCCAICKSGCAGCGGCDYPVYTPTGHNGQQLHCASVVDSSPNFQVTTVGVANPLNLCAEATGPGIAPAPQTQEPTPLLKLASQDAGL